jgi:hypothetical protein
LIEYFHLNLKIIAENFSIPNDFYWIQIRTDSDTDSAVLSYEEIDYNPAPAVGEYTEHKVSVHVFQIFPSPTHSTTTIQYTLTESAHVILKIYNVLGQEIKTLVNETQTYGPKTVVWDGRDNQGRFLSSGIYFCRLHAGDFEQSKKLIWVKKILAQAENKEFSM